MAQFPIVHNAWLWALLALVAVTPAAQARAPAPGKWVTQSAAPDLERWPGAAVWPGVPVGTEVVVSRGKGCGPLYRVRFSPRRARDCAAEEQVRLVVKEGGKVEMLELPVAKPRLPALPAQLALQWRVCPFRTVAAMEQPQSPWVRYEDPELGPCYLWRPLDWVRWAEIAKRVGDDKLADIHPYLAASLKELAVRAAARGIEVRLIGGRSAITIHQPKGANHGSKKSTATKGKAKAGERKGKVRNSTKGKNSGKAKGKGKGAKAVRSKKPFRTAPYTYLHCWGLAVDLTTGWGKPLRNPDRAYQPGSQVWVTFQLLGAWAEEMGITWLGRTMKGELVHFEFHPHGWGTVAGAELTAMLKLHAEQGAARTHDAFAADPQRSAAFAALKDEVSVP